MSRLRSEMETLHNRDVDQAKKKASDIKVFGDGNLFMLISKVSSEAEGWMKSTKAMPIPNVGCVVQVTTQQGDQIAEALTFVPGVYVGVDNDGNPKLRKFP